MKERIKTNVLAASFNEYQPRAPQLSKEQLEIAHIDHTTLLMLQLTIVSATHIRTMPTMPIFYQP